MAAAPIHLGADHGGRGARSKFGFEVRRSSVPIPHSLFSIPQSFFQKTGNKNPPLSD